MIGKSEDFVRVSLEMNRKELEEVTQAIGDLVFVGNKHCTPTMRSFYSVFAKAFTGVDLFKK